MLFRSKTPVKIGAYCMLLNTTLCALFIWPLQHAGLTLASAITGYVNALTLLMLLWRRGIYTPCVGWPKFLAQLGLANLILGIYLTYFSGSVADWMALGAGMRLMHLISFVGSAGFIYLACLGISGVRFSHFKGQVLEQSA